MREQRPQAQQDDGVPLPPEERELICDMAAWSGMSKQGYIFAKLTDTKVEARPSASVQKALRDSIAELAKEVRLAASYGELSESLQQRIKLVMEFFLANGEPVGAPAEEEPQIKAPSAVPKTPETGAGGARTSSAWDAGSG